MVKIKICGLRDGEHALIAAEAGADMIGLVFAESPRRVSVAQAQAIAQLLRIVYKENSPKLVGLFVNAALAVINDVAAQVGLDYVQLCGEEPVTMLPHLNCKVIKAVRCGGQPDVDDLLREVEAWHSAGATILLDAPGVGGGHGKLADWQYAASVARRYPIILAGGLNPGNVAEAVAMVQPAAVDVSSGVERERGAKDANLIRQFIAAAKQPAN